jgi:hypothetical protein
MRPQGNDEDQPSMPATSIKQCKTPMLLHSLCGMMPAGAADSPWRVQQRMHGLTYSFCIISASICVL